MNTISKDQRQAAEAPGLQGRTAVEKTRDQAPDAA